MKSCQGKASRIRSAQTPLHSSTNFATFSKRKKNLFVFLPNVEIVGRKSHIDPLPFVWMMLPFCLHGLYCTSGNPLRWYFNGALLNYSTSGNCNGTEFRPLRRVSTFICGPTNKCTCMAIYTFLCRREPLLESLFVNFT